APLGAACRHWCLAPRHLLATGRRPGPAGLPATPARPDRVGAWAWLGFAGVGRRLAGEPARARRWLRGKLAWVRLRSPSRRDWDAASVGPRAVYHRRFLRQPDEYRVQAVLPSLGAPGDCRNYWLSDHRQPATEAGLA